ncbi:asparagine--tRNA ligase [Theileria parva strain Muguga]|uniref:asparagine--tRNA ligase n=1 Tax=Theileria parva TaxID=5875 RepID=Q4N492_THEPA|nr:asparagine--tRNA ligase [Theileria parva strain Muguga]EAN33031.1 asparagine--tRNA ligase [Theileria parva strain Muguga]|eukprot:XP_765314.1 asparaginyl-tRNA synthetase [Theileria parva strain Muguga]
MAPNLGLPNSELLKKAREMAGRLTVRDSTKVTKISALLSSLRRNPFDSRYESVSDSINKVINNSSTTKIPSTLTFQQLDLILNKKSLDDTPTGDHSNTKPTDTPEVKNVQFSTTGGTSGAQSFETSKNDLEHDQKFIKEKCLVRVFGWCKSMRSQDGGRLLFVIVNDGSCKSNLQIVVHNDSKGYKEALKCKSGTSIQANGFLVNRETQPKPPTEVTKENNPELPEEVKDYELLDEISNRYELHITSDDSNYIQVLGVTNSPGTYPIAKKDLTMEFLRENAHLRPRTYLISAVMRVRSSLSIAIHLFFQSKNFHYLNSPVITTADCEGAGELFQVTTLFENVKNVKELVNKMYSKDPQPEVSKNSTNSENSTNSDSKLSNDAENTSSVQPEGANSVNGTQPKDTNSKVDEPDGKTDGKTNAVNTDYKLLYKAVDFKKDFFKKKSYLTCSGQLSAENYCCSMGSVYTFGPTFRAENSHTNRHLSEFWMIEPEMTLVDLPGLMEITEEFIKFLVNYILKHNYDDLVFFNNTVDKELLSRLYNIVDNEFVHLSYTSVIDILQEYIKQNPEQPFEYNDVHWGIDLQSEHERFISEKVFNGPVIIYNYPKQIKAFYMRRNDDGKTVAAMDLIIPKIGELIGGSQREERFDYLEKSIKENKLNMQDYWWYMDLRRYGTIVHSGFGLGFERLIMMVTGVQNIKDVIPFPRYSGHSLF